MSKWQKPTKERKVTFQKGSNLMKKREVNISKRQELNIGKGNITQRQESHTGKEKFNILQNRKHIRKGIKSFTKAETHIEKGSKIHVHNSKYFKENVIYFL